MKVFVALLLAISSVVARGSGPYLPSGWRPDGPAFNLPSEVAQPVLITAQEPLVEETEASGSDALREYGPPKLEVLVNANQGLPNVKTEQTPIQATKIDEVAVDVQEVVNIEGNTEQVAAIIEETSTAIESNGAEAIKPLEEEAAALTDQPEPDRTAGSPATNAVDQEEVSADIAQTEKANEPEQNDAPAAILKDSVISTAVADEVVVPLYQQELQQDTVPTVGLETVADHKSVPEAIPTSEVVASVVQQEQELTQEAVSAPVEDVAAEREVVGINDIVEVIASLVKEVKAAEVQANENAADITPTQAISGTSEQSPEGFLEYGPPGFLEYGPPNQQLFGSSAAEVTGASVLENNEVRRRRYSPKFSSPKKH